MKDQSLMNKMMPHFYAVLIFVVLLFIYTSPAMEGKELQQADMIQVHAMAKEVKDFYEKNGELSLWTGSMFSGMPAFQIFSKQYGNLFDIIYRTINTLPNPTGFLLLGAIVFYFFLFSLNCGTVLSIIGALAFTFSSYNFIILEVGHITKAIAIAYMGGVLAGILICFRGKYLLGGVMTAFFLTLELHSNHVQISYYLLLTILVLIIVHFVFYLREKNLKHFFTACAVLAASAVFGILPNVNSLWITYEYGEESMRGKGSELTSNKETAHGGLEKDYALAWSYGVGETMTLLIPDFYGGTSSEPLAEKKSKTLRELQQLNNPQQANQLYNSIRKYWGDQPGTSGPVYFGAIICFLFILGLFIIKGKTKWWIVSATVLSIVLCWGKNFQFVTDLFFDYFPMYNKFRTVSMTLVIAELTFPLLAILVLKEIFENAQQKKFDANYYLKAVKNSFYITGGLCLLFALFGGSLMSFLSPAESQANLPSILIDALKADRIDLLRSDSIRSLVFIALAFGTLWFFIKGKIKSNYAMGILGLLVLIDLWGVDKRYLNDADFSKPKKQREQYQPTQADMFILQDKDPNYRVFNVSGNPPNPFNEAFTSYFHKSIGGYHPAKLRRYQELIENQISHNNMNVLNMLNTKYFIVSSKEGQPVPRQNPDAAGNAWFVKEIKMVNNADEEMDALTYFNPKDTAIVDKRFAEYLKGLNLQSAISNSQSAIQLTEYQPNHLTYQSKSSSEQLAVFSEIYYNSGKGWQATIDGKEIEHIRVNYVLRAMRIPAGEHKIEFRFYPKTFYTGEKISLAGSIILLLGIFFVGYKEMKSKKGN